MTEASPEEIDDASVYPDLEDLVEGPSPHRFFETLYLDIYNTYDRTYWTDKHYKEFMTLIKNPTATASELLAWLLCIENTGVEEYLTAASDDRCHDDGLPGWMLRFRSPSVTTIEDLNDIDE